MIRTTAICEISMIKQPTIKIVIASQKIRRSREWQERKGYSSVLNFRGGLELCGECEG